MIYQPKNQDGKQAGPNDVKGIPRNKEELARGSIRFSEQPDIAKLQQQTAKVRHDEVGNATNVIRPFKHLYQQLKWLNHFAITNDMAVTKLLGEMNESMLETTEYQLMVRNLETFLENSQFKHHRFIPALCNDIIEIYANMFAGKNKRRAESALEEQQDVSAGDIIVMSLLNGISVAIIAVMVHNYWKELHHQGGVFLAQIFQLMPILRLLLYLAYLPFAAGLCIMVWKNHEINYIYIMQIDFKNRMSGYQLWKFGSMVLFVFIVIAYSLMHYLMLLHAEPNNFSNYELHQMNESGLEQVRFLKFIFAIVACSLMLFLWINPFKFQFRKMRYQVIEAFFHVIFAPIGNVKFRTYLLAEILTDSLIQLEDIGKIATYFMMNNWGANLLSK